MKHNLGELEKGKILFAILAGIAFAWLIYSRFSFHQDPVAADKGTAVERELKESRDEAASLRRRIDDIEHRLSTSSPPRPPSPLRGKAK